MKGFNGYAYKFYTQITKQPTVRIRQCSLLTIYQPTAEGIATYREGNGVYSTNSTVQQDIDSLLDGFVLENYTVVETDAENYLSDSKAEFLVGISFAVYLVYARIVFVRAFDCG